MIPIPNIGDMEEIALESALQYYDKNSFEVLEKYRIKSKPEEYGDWIVIDVEPL